MKNLTLDSILIFALLIPFVMTYRISPSDTPYWLFGLIFLGLLSYISLDLFFKFKSSILNKIKLLLFWILVLSTIGSAFYSAIIVRHQTSPVYNVHDIIIQQEVAIRYLLHGKNPYSETYFGTPLEEWNYSETEINPALYHFVMQPFYLVFSIPFYLLTTRTIDFFDGRIPLLFLFIVSLITIQKLVKESNKKLLFMTLFAFNPGTLGYLLEGRDDMFMFSFFLLAIFFIHKNKNVFGNILMGFAFAVKQSIWPIFPFYFAYTYFKNKNFRKTLYELLPFAVTFLVITLPFILWNAKAYFDSTILYLSGNAADSYPIAGYGFGKFLNQLGFIKDVHYYYPFWIWQAVVGLPILVALIIWLKKENSIQRLILSYAIFLFVFWYFSRYFNNSHLGYISTVLLTAYFWPKNE